MRTLNLFLTLHSMQATIRLNNLSIGYQEKGQGRKLIAQGINATLYAGELTCLLGSNGAGKSTLLRTLSAFLSPLDGEIIVGDKPLHEYTDGERARTISVVRTEKNELTHTTVYELVSLGRTPYTDFWGNLTPEDHQTVSQSLKAVGMLDFAQRKVDTLSDGERQKVMIAKALAQQTPVIILDEPTAFLDFPSKIETMLLLSQLAHQTQKTILLSTHDLELALQTADRLWLMKRDRNHTADKASENTDTVCNKADTVCNDENKAFNHTASENTDTVCNKADTVCNNAIFQASPIQTGKPDELAQNGVLGCLFTGDGFTFDTHEMRFKINK